MSRKTSTRAILVAMSLMGPGVLGSATGVAPGSLFIAVAEAQEDPAAIDVGAIFKLLESEATRAEGLKQLAAAAAAGDAAAMGRLALIQINGEFGTTAD